MRTPVEGLLHVEKLMRSAGFVNEYQVELNRRKEREPRRIRNLRIEIPREGGLRTFVSGSNRRVRQPLSELL
jgi:hypothetical protein